MWFIENVIAARGGVFASHRAMVGRLAATGCGCAPWMVRETKKKARPNW
jgi:hypothetical protein